MSALILAQVAVVDTARAAPARTVLALLLTYLGPASIGSGDLAQARRRRAADPPMDESETRLLDDAMQLVLELSPVRP